MSKPALFLETTIQIERVVAHSLRKSALRQELAAYRLITSTYVFGEYLRTLVQDAIRLHGLITEHIYLDEVLTRIGQHPNKSESSRMALILGSVLRVERLTGQLSVGNSHDLLDLLSDEIEFLLPKRFMYGIEELINSTGCGLAKERPIASYLPLSPTPSYRLRCQCVCHVRECDLAELLRDRWQAELKALAEGLVKESDPVLVRMGKLAAQIQDNPILARGRNCTWHLGDMVIALELPPDVPLYTTNRRHFSPLLTILGKKLHSSETPA